MANEQATATFNNAFKLKERLNGTLDKLKAARAEIDAQIMDTCISIQAADRMMETLSPHINQTPPHTEEELDKQMSGALEGLDAAT